MADFYYWNDPANGREGGTMFERDRDRILSEGPEIEDARVIRKWLRLKKDLRDEAYAPSKAMLDARARWQAKEDARNNRFGVNGAARAAIAQQNNRHAAEMELLQKKQEFEKWKREQDSLDIDRKGKVDVNVENIKKDSAIGVADKNGYWGNEKAKTEGYWGNEKAETEGIWDTTKADREGFWKNEVEQTTQDGLTSRNENDRDVAYNATDAAIRQKDIDREIAVIETNQKAEEAKLKHAYDMATDETERMKIQERILISRENAENELRKIQAQGKETRATDTNKGAVDIDVAAAAAADDRKAAEDKYLYEYSLLKQQQSLQRELAVMQDETKRAEIQSRLDEVNATLASLEKRNEASVGGQVAVAAIGKDASANTDATNLSIAQSNNATSLERADRDNAAAVLLAQRNAEAAASAAAASDSRRFAEAAKQRTFDAKQGALDRASRERMNQRDNDAKVEANRLKTENENEQKEKDRALRESLQKELIEFRKGEGELNRKVQLAIADKQAAETSGTENPGGMTSKELQGWVGLWVRAATGGQRMSGTDIILAADALKNAKTDEERAAITKIAEAGSGDKLAEFIMSQFIQPQLQGVGQSQGGQPQGGQPQGGQPQGGQPKFYERYIRQ